jgi:hypothetical protein
MEGPQTVVMRRPIGQRAHCEHDGPRTSIRAFQLSERVDHADQSARARLITVARHLAIDERIAIDERRAR